MKKFFSNEDFIPMLTFISVILGLGVVMWELQQNRDMTRLQLYSDGFINNTQSAVALSGENPAVSIAKACEDPESLTSSDLEVLNFFYTQSVERITRIQLLGSGLYDENAWRTFIPDRFGQIFETEVGRAWWVLRSNGTSELERAVDRFLAGLGPPDCLERNIRWINLAKDMKARP